MSSDDSVERMNADAPAVIRTLKGRVVAFAPERHELRMQFEIGLEFCHTVDIVQGGFITAMLDEAAGICAIAHAQRRVGMPTLEFKVSFLSVVRPGRVEVAARVLKMGGRTAFIEADVVGADGATLARMTTTAMPIELAAPKLVTRDS